MNVNTILTVAAGTAVGGAKLIAMGCLLAIGFQIGNTIAVRIAKRIEGRHYQNLEQATEAPSGTY